MTRFGLGLLPYAAPGHDPVADAVRAERLGYDFVSLDDPSKSSLTFPHSDD